jgi:short subunit dehydrogenase-like uncharacterized protein
VTKNWMIYGAYGFTGTLITDEALLRGHRPLLAGRSKEKLAPLAERFGLESRPVDLNDAKGLRAILAEVDLVFHAAGPYSRTSRPMLLACLDTGTPYLDITGELPVFQHTLSLDATARQAGICLVSGVGFDVVPTDCLAVMLAKQVAQPVHLELAITGTGGGISAGTLKSGLEILSEGGWIRRRGELVKVPMGGGVQRIPFSHGLRPALRSPLGDLVTAYASTGIPNITTYIGQGHFTAPLANAFIPLLHAFLQSDRLRQWAASLANRIAPGPSREAQFQRRSYAWGRVTDTAGRELEGCLEMPEGYRFTALSAVRAVEHVLEFAPIGALTPAQALGPGFVHKIPGVKRF